ncbi:MAG: mechanosensitive ion channel family protein [Candidatus Bathyarchaeota archaeon]|nr:mechanosensitive ion channel family protein [Candidatus Bathyarchaeota archaeon]
MVERILITAVILAVIALGYKLFIRFVSRAGEELELDMHAMNAVRLVIRVAAIVVASSAVFTIFEVPTTIFIGGSALIGAFLGFGSSQTINNIVAGFYVLVTQPFRVMDYVRIGDLEGQVEEIAINYTNLYTPTFNLLKVPNTYVMNSRVLNMTHEGFIKYTFDLGFSHDIPSPVIMERCIQPAIEEFQEKHEADQLRMPEAYLDDSDRLGLTFLFRFFIPKGEAKKLYVLKPELLGMIMRRWGELKRS